MDQYVVPELAALIHAIPHFNFTFHILPAKFNVSNSAYIESLVAMGSLPALWLVLTLLLLLLYLFTRCCCIQHKHKRSFIGLKWSLGFGATLTCLVLAAGFYGNYTLHEGVVTLGNSVKSISDTFANVRNKTLRSESLLLHDVSRGFEDLRKLFMSGSRPSNASIVRWLDAEMSWMGVNVSEDVATMRNMTVDTQHVQTDALPAYIRLSETIRWPGTLILLILLTAFCGILLVGVLRHSRFLLLFFSVASLFAVITCYMLGSVHTFVALGLSDFCVSPDATVRAALVSQFAAPALGDSVAEYYLNCSRPSRPSPWQPALLAGQRHVQLLLDTLANVNSVALKYYPSAQLEPAVAELRVSLNSTLSAYNSITELLHCEHIHQLYIQALDALCDTALLGLTILLLTLLVCGFAFTILAWCDAHAWIHIQKRRDYLRVDTSDPYGTTCRRPPSLSALNSVGAPAGSASGLRAGGRGSGSPHGSLLASRYHTTPPTLRTRTPPFPTASHGAGGGSSHRHQQPGPPRHHQHNTNSLLPFSNGRVSEYRSGTLPTPRYSPATPSAPDPPPYTAALMASADHSDYDNYG